MLITLDKLLYIVHPLRYDSFINLRQATAIALSVWLFSTLVAFINKFAPWAHTTWYWSLEKSITLILPIGVSIAVSIYLLILVVGKHRGGTTSVYPHIKPPSWKKRSRTVVFIFATTFWTVACLLPNMIVWGIANDTFNWWTIEWHEHLYAVTRMWAYFDHVGNPLITIFVNVFYRKLMINFILNVGRHMRTEVDSESSRSNNNVVAGHEETKVW